MVYSIILGANLAESLEVSTEFVKWVITSQVETANGEIPLI